MARIYTRTGDGGETSLGDGRRVSKSDPRVDVYGDVDELNCVLGRAVTAADGDAPAGLVDELVQLQNRLFDLGAVLADPVRSANPAGGPDAFGAGELESYIDARETDLEPLRNFILPGGCALAAELHLARAVCRRCERRAVALAADVIVPAAALTYLNRLSDYLFVAARAANAAAGLPDVTWRPIAADD